MAALAVPGLGDACAAESPLERMIRGEMGEEVTPGARAAAPDE